MAYLDSTRTSTLTATHSQGVTIRIWNPFTVKPTIETWQEMWTDFTIAGHCGFSASLVWNTTNTATGGPGSSWNWQLIATVTCNNGAGTSNTGNIIVSSGTAAGTTQYIDATASITGNLTCSQGTDKLWDITETGYSSTSAPTQCPPPTAYRQYELTTLGATSTCSLSVNGSSVTATGAATSRTTANYTATLSSNSHTIGPATHSFSVGSVQVNGINVHDIPHTHTFHAQSASEWSMSVTGIIDAFGVYNEASGTISTSSTLDRVVALQGRIRAWESAYPDALNVVVTGLDGSSRTVGASGGSWSASDTFVKYSTTTVLNDPVYGSDTKSTSANTVPTSISAAITAASLTTNGDGSGDTRVLFRGWRFNGWTISGASTYSISGTGNDRAFSPRQGMSSYRWLDIQVKAQTAAPASGVIEITDYKGNTKQYNVTATATTFTTVSIDLCSPASWSVSALPVTDGKDDPYPRVNTSSTSYAGSESTDSAYWGVTSTSRIRVLSGAIDIGTTTLRAASLDTTYVPSSMTYAPQRVTPAIVSGDGTTTWYYTRRFWHLDADGRTEEEGDVWWQKTVGGVTGVTTYTTQILPIVDLATQIGTSDSIVVRHPGWSATRSIPKPGGTTCTVSQPPLRDCYLNGDTGYSTWLYGGGALATPNATSGTDWTYPHQVMPSLVVAQTLFDSINGDFVPDWFDPFDVNGGTDAALYLCGASLLRGIAHGFVLTNTGGIGTTATIDLKLDSTSANRGTDSTLDAAGRYFTATPWGLGEQVHSIVLGSNSIGVNPLRTSKRYKGVFRAASIGGACTAADVDLDLTATYGIIDSSGNVQLYFALGPNATNWFNVTPGISGATCLSMAYRKTNDVLVIDVDHSDGTCKRYETSNRGKTISVATVLGTGAHAAVCIHPNGNEYHFWRTSAGAIQRLKRDPQGNTIVAASNVVASGVGDDELACFVRLDVVYLIYTNTSGSIIMVSSQDDGNTFS